MMNLAQTQTALITNKNLNDCGLTIMTEVVKQIIDEANQVIDEAIEINPVILGYFVDAFDNFASHIAEKEYWGQEFHQDFYLIAGAALLQKVRIQKYYSEQ